MSDHECFHNEVGQTMCSYIFLVTVADFFLINGARPNPPPQWGTGESRVSDNRCLTRFVGEAREEGASRPSIEGEAKDE